MVESPPIPERILAPLSKLRGNSGTRRWLEQALASGRLPHALLISGPRGIGKRTLALSVAGHLLCEVRSACGSCAACRALRKGHALAHVRVHPEEGSRVIKIQQIRELSRAMHLAAPGDRGRLVVIEGAERMGPEAQDALLKTLEEPPPGNLLLLLAERPDAILPTVRSRCQRLALGRLGDEDLQALVDSWQLRPRLPLAAAAGCPGRLAALADPELPELREGLLALLADARLAHSHGAWAALLHRGLPAKVDRNPIRQRALRAWELLAGMARDLAFFSVAAAFSAVRTGEGAATGATMLRHPDLEACLRAIADDPSWRQLATWSDPSSLRDRLARARQRIDGALDPAAALLGCIRGRDDADASPRRNHAGRRTMKSYTTVRYGHIRRRGLFAVETREEVEPGDVCLVRTSRGEELGTVLTWPTGREGEGRPGCGSGACGSCASVQGRVLRKARDAEVEGFRELERQGTRDEIVAARKFAQDRGMTLRVLDAEYLFERNKLVIQYSAEQRLDVTALVRDLGQRFDTRIEMFQVGARDEARLVGDMASCGRELCCRTFLHDLKPVSMRMAKQQKKTLDPTKISGQCGKLKCCLRYEDEVYVELQKSMPKRGVWVEIEAGVGRIVTIDLLLQRVVVRPARRPPDRPRLRTAGDGPGRSQARRAGWQPAAEEGQAPGRAAAIREERTAAAPRARARAGSSARRCRGRSRRHGHHRGGPRAPSPGAAAAWPRPRGRPRRVSRWWRGHGADTGPRARRIGREPLRRFFAGPQRHAPPPQAAIPPGGARRVLGGRSFRVRSGPDTADISPCPRTAWAIGFRPFSRSRDMSTPGLSLDDRIEKLAADVGRYSAEGLSLRV